MATTVVEQYTDVTKQVVNTVYHICDVPQTNFRNY